MSSNTKVYEEKMKSSVEHLGRELAAVRAGRANPAVLDKVTVDYYGAPTPIQQVASVAVSEARTLTIRETTALGAAYLAGLATGVWKDRDEIRSLWHCNMTFTPAMPEAERARLLSGWHKAVGRSSDWAEH